MHRNCLRVLLGFARELGWTTENVAIDIRLPKSAKPAARPPITPAMARLVRMKERNPILKDLWWTLGVCGLRPGEAFTLMSDALTFDRGVWWLVVPGTKTDAAARRVPVPMSLADRLRRRQGLLFPSENLTPMTQSNVARAWKWALDRAGLEHTNLYQLRKACLTHWIERGMPDDAVKYFAGHVDIALTKNRYQRITTGRLSSAIEHAGLSSKYVNPLGKMPAIRDLGSK